MFSVSQLEWKVNEMNSDEMKKAIVAMFEAFEKDFRNPEKILEQVAEDGEFWVAGNTPYSGTTTRGQKLKQLKSGRSKRFSCPPRTPRTAPTHGFRNV